MESPKLKDAEEYFLGSCSLNVQQVDKLMLSWMFGAFINRSFLLIFECVHLRRNRNC